MDIAVAFLRFLADLVAAQPLWAGVSLVVTLLLVWVWRARRAYRAPFADITRRNERYKRAGTRRSGDPAD